MGKATSEENDQHDHRLPRVNVNATLGHTVNSSKNDDGSTGTSPASQMVTINDNNNNNNSNSKSDNDQPKQAESTQTQSADWAQEFEQLNNNNNNNNNNIDTTTTNTTHKNNDSDSSDKHSAATEPKAADPEWCARGLALPLSGQPKGVAHAALEFLQGLIRGASIGFASKAALGLAFSALKGFRARRGLQAVFAKDNARFALFMGLFCGSFRGINALLALARGVDDAVNAAIAGGVAGLSMLVDDKERRAGLSLLLLVRAMDVSVRRLARDKVIPTSQYAVSVLFGMVNMPIAYGYLYEPAILPRGYYSWIQWAGQVDDKTLKLALRCPRCDQVHFHSGSCARAHSFEFITNVFRFFKMYAPVHILPLIAFRRHALMDDPVGQAKRLVQAIFASSSFLSTYVILLKGSMCFFEQVQGDHAHWHTLVGGLLTGFSTRLEHPGRVSELMLYCMPRGMESAWNAGVARKLLKPLPLWDLLLFSCASAVLMGSDRADFKPALFGVTRWILGSRKEKVETEKLKKEEEEAQTAGKQ